MKAYYIHWIYPASADDELFYGGKDDEKLFYHKERAQTYALSVLKQIEDAREKLQDVVNKRFNLGINSLTGEELEKYAEYQSLHDYPNNYAIHVREITFEDKV